MSPWIMSAYLLFLSLHKNLHYQGTTTRKQRIRRGKWLYRLNVYAKPFSNFASESGGLGVRSFFARIYIILAFEMAK